MKLENIGFYTLENKRALEVCETSPLWRCELLLTDKCNFKCPYCRGTKKEFKGEKTFDEAKRIVDYWIKDGIKNIRFSGGEPTTWNGLINLVSYCKNNVLRIAVSTNGSAEFEYYKDLITAGVNDFSISLDACCASSGDKMAGGIKNSWIKVTDNILRLAELTYVTVGIVLTDDTINIVKDIVNYADSLGVSDIRIISSAQYDKAIEAAKTIDDKLLEKYPILKYRVNNFRNGRNVRGIEKYDTNKCHLVKDDMAIIGDYHFPCIIYLREGGEPIGKVGPNMRQKRFEWFKNHDSKKIKYVKKIV